ncbi:alpha/beta fold hydrolase [Bdellovibrionota bacterium]
MKEGRVKSKDGTSIFYRVEGEGFPLVFCYGVTCGPWHFDYQREYFKDKFQLIFVDYRGHNNSEMPKSFTDLTVHGCAEDVKAVVEHLGLEKAVFIGHSVGVPVIIELTSMIPERIAGLALICGGVTNPFKTMFKTPFSQIGFELLKLSYLRTPKVFQGIFKQFIPSPFGHAMVSMLGYNKALSQRDDIQRYLDGVAKHPPETMLYLLNDYSKYDGSKLLPKIKAPTLVIGGENDLITPIEHQEHVAKEIPNSEFLKIPYASHCTQQDMPEFVNLKLETWLKKILSR